jgi:hypothetical protein
MIPEPSPNPSSSRHIDPQPLPLKKRAPKAPAFFVSKGHVSKGHAYKWQHTVRSRNRV